jgi:hypothetical protein
MKPKEISKDRKSTLGRSMVRVFRKWNSKVPSRRRIRENNGETYTESSEYSSFEPCGSAESSISSGTESLHRRLSLDVDEEIRVPAGQKNSDTPTSTSSSQYLTPRSQLEQEENLHHPRQKLQASTRGRDSLISMVIYPKRTEPSLPDSLQLWSK